MPTTPTILYQPFATDCLKIGGCVHDCAQGWCEVARDTYDRFTQEEKKANTRVQQALEEGAARRAAVRQTLRRS